MKKHPILAALFVGATLLGSPSAGAALVYNPGDIFLGFRGTGNSESYLVNVGNVAQFANLSPGTSITVNTGGNIALDLTTAFGANWNARSDVFWSLTGTTFNGSPDLTATLYATRARTNANTQSVPWRGRSNSGQTESVSLLQALAGKYVTEGVATANSTKATFQDATSDNSYAFFTLQNSDFAIGGSVEGSFGNSTAGSVLDFYRIDPVDDQAAVYLGRFTINDTGAITFTAVPEPSTVALLGLSVAGLFLFLRRRTNRRDF